MILIKKSILSILLISLLLLNSSVSLALEGETQEKFSESVSSIPQNNETPLQEIRDISNENEEVIKEEVIEEEVIEEEVIEEEVIEEEVTEEEVTEVIDNPKPEVINDLAEYTGRLIVIYKSQESAEVPATTETQPAESPVAIEVPAITEAQLIELTQTEQTSKNRKILKNRFEVSALENTNTFQEVLNSAISKLISSGKISNLTTTLKSRKNLRFQTEQSEEIAYIEDIHEHVNSYVVKVNDPINLDNLKSVLEEEDGVVHVIKDRILYIDPVIEITDTEIPSNVEENPTTRGHDTIIGPQLPCEQRLLQEAPLPNDPYNRENWYFYQTGLANAWLKTCICPANISQAQCNIKDNPQYCNLGSSNIPVAILDNGFSVGNGAGTTLHRDLEGRWETAICRNVIKDKNEFDYDSSDEFFHDPTHTRDPYAGNFDHGTAVALSAAANLNNNYSHAGIVQNSKLWGIRIAEGEKSSFVNFSAGLNHVIIKIKELNIKHFVVNLSFGNDTLCSQKEIFDLNDYGKQIKELGGLFTYAGGNTGCQMKGISLGEAGFVYDTGKDILVVGSATSNDRTGCGDIDIANDSAFGFSTDIFAPGDFILDLKNKKNITNYELKKYRVAGTSFAAPAFAGYAALLWSLNSNLTPDQVEKILKVSSFNSLGIFNLNTKIGGDDPVGNFTSGEVIKLSQAPLVRIDDAIELQNEILDLNISTEPDTGEFIETNPTVKTTFNVKAAFQTSANKIILEVLDLPSGATFEKIEGFGNVTQTFDWTPNPIHSEGTFPVTFLARNSSNKVIGYKKIYFIIKNRPPVANAGPEQIDILDGTSIQLDGSGSSDPDGDEITYDWLQTSPTSTSKRAEFSDKNAQKPTITLPEIGTSKNLDFKFRLKVKDSHNSTSISTVTIKVINLNKKPKADAGSNQKNAPDGTTIQLDGSGSSDPDGDKITYEWKQSASDTVKIVLINPNTPKPTFLAPEVKKDTKFLFILTVKDPEGSSNSALLSITVKNINKKPIADAGPDQPTVPGESIVTLDGSKSHDPDIDENDVVETFEWIPEEKTTLSINPTDPSKVSFIAPIAGEPITLKFKLKVTDKKGASAEDIVLVTVVNRAPISNPGSPQSIKMGRQFNLDGSNSSDPDRHTISYNWTQIDGPQATLSNASVPTSPVFVAPIVTGNNNATCKFKLKVTDEFGLSSESTVDVNVFNNSPISNAGVSKNVKGQSKVTLAGSGSDPDSDPITYQWTQVLGTTVTLNNSNSPQATFVSPKANRNNTTLKFKLTVNDGIVSVESFVNIEILKNSNNTAPTAKASGPKKVKMGTPVTLSSKGSADKDKDPLTYSWTASGGITLSDRSSSSPTFTAPAVTKNTNYTFTLIVNDGIFNSKAVKTIVTVTK